MNAADRVIEKVNEKKNPTIIGLDPRFDMIPLFITEEAVGKYGSSLKAVAESYKIFNRRIIDITCGVAGFVKPQCAFYEQAGAEGIIALKDTIDYARLKGMIVILDGKRNDIGTTAEAYTKSYLAKYPFEGINENYFDADFLTVTPYLGSDGILPFVKTCKDDDKGIFVLVKTSNISSGEFQDQVVNQSGEKIYELAAKKVDLWGKELVGKKGYSSIGAVVGATYPQEAKVLRILMPNTIFLVPGYGAQGGTAKAVMPCFNKDGYGALINSSRGITFPYKDRSISEEEFDEKVLKAALDMKEDIRTAMEEAGIYPW